MTTRRRVAFVEFPVYDQFPLASGYLHAYARADAAIDKEFEFVYFQKDVYRAEYPAVLKELRALDASIICFSCYVWNMGLVARLVRDLAADPKIDWLILGGHQASHHIGRYFEATNDKTIIINGQGEIPFRATLQQLAGSNRIAPLEGISFYSGGQLCDGGEAKMLSNLDDIPSPYLGGIFDQMIHPIAIFETNRGCPYQCSFCTWGGDTFTVAKFPLERIKEELDWIARKLVMFVYLADANWGMLPRDVELSEYIARLKRDHRFPWMVYYASAKNNPKRSLACIEKLHEGGVVATQDLGIQSMNPMTLELINRKNIKNSAYIELFEGLNERKIDSYCELIWPLPGETLETLKAGFEHLLDLGARTIIMYPTLLINNAKLTEQAAEWEMETIACADWRSELRLVKKTKFARRSEVDEGFWFYYSLFLLGNCDPRKALLRFLRDRTGKTFAAIVSEFADSLRTEFAQFPYAGLIKSIFESEEHGDTMTVGRLAAHVTYEARLAAQADVARFVAQQIPGDPDGGLVFSTLWAFCLPKIFGGTRDDYGMILDVLKSLGPNHGGILSKLASASGQEGSILLEVGGAEEKWRETVSYFTGGAAVKRISRVEIRHPGAKLPYNSGDPEHNFVYAHGMILRLGHTEATISVS